MADTKQQQRGQPLPTIALVAALAAVALVSALVMLGSAASFSGVDASAAPVAVSVPDQIVSPEEHNAFIREGHERAAREGDGAPLPATF